MRLIRLALALVAVSISWVASANPAINSSVSGTVSTSATTQMVGGPAHQVRLNGTSLRGDSRSSLRSSSSSADGGMNDSVPSGWLMALVTVLLIGHQLRRKHRFLRPQRFSNL